MQSGYDINATAATFIDGFRQIQRFNGQIDAGESHGIRYLVFAGGRRASRFTHEFFPHKAEPAQVIAAILELDPIGDHLISVLGSNGESQITAYRDAGYEHWGSEMLMVRDLNTHLPTPALIEVQSISDLEEGERIVDAQNAAGLPAHPITEAHLNASDVVHRWVASDGLPAAFGRIVLVGNSAYLSDVVTLPEFRRRGFADALMKQLLLDARDAGAATCVLTSSEMGHRLYQSLGFTDVLPLTGFQTPARTQ